MSNTYGTGYSGNLDRHYFEPNGGREANALPLEPFWAPPSYSRVSGLASFPQIVLKEKGPCFLWEYMGYGRRVVQLIAVKAKKK